MVTVLFCPGKKAAVLLETAVFQTNEGAVRPRSIQEQLLIFGHEIEQYTLSHFFLPKLEQPELCWGELMKLLIIK